MRGAVSLAGDVKSETYARALVDLALTRFGGLDIAFNNAGTTGTPGSVPGLELAQWQETLDTNLTSAFVGPSTRSPPCRHAGAALLIFTSTFVGHTLGLPGMAAYAASKAGLIGLTQVLAAEYGAQGVRVNALLPGHRHPHGAGLLPIHRRVSPLCNNSTPSNGWPNRRRSPARPLYLASDASSFYHRHCSAGRWWGIYLSHMTLSPQDPATANLIDWPLKIQTLRPS